MVKYLLNNRRHATYWNSTRDTAICVEALADYLKASGEDRPDMTVEVWLDGKKHKEVHIDKTNLFSFDNKLVLIGDKVTTGKHTLEIKRKGSGPVYFNAYVTYFTLEDFITKAGLEVQRQPQVLQADPRRGQDQGLRLQGASARSSRSRNTSAPSWRTWPRSRAATWSRWSSKSTPRTITST